MQRILQLTAEALRSGVARSAHDDKGGAWASAIGLNPFLSDDASRFLLAVTAAPTRIGSTEITDIPIAYCHHPNSSTAIVYILGSSGRFYSLLPNGTVSVIRPQSVLTVLTNPTGGMIPITDSGGNAYLIIMARQTLVRWNLNTGDSATHWNTSNGLTSSNHHPIWKALGDAYFGDGQHLGFIPLDQLHNQATALVNINFQLIDFGLGQTVTAGGDDGRYILAAISQEFDETGNASRDARIIWYPGIGSNWDWEVTLKGERAVRAIVRDARGVFAIGEQTEYQLAFGQQPRLVRTFATEDSPGGAFNAIAQDVGPRAAIAAPFGDSHIFGKRGAIYGRRYPTEKVTLSHPLQGHTDDISMVMPDFIKNAIYVGTEDSRLFKYDMSSAGNTSNVWATRFFRLGQEFNIKEAHIELPTGIGANDVVGLTVEVPSGQTATATLRQSTVDSENRNYAKLSLDATLKGSRVRISLTPSAGTPRLGDICLYGEPT